MNEEGLRYLVVLLGVLCILLISLLNRAMHRIERWKQHSLDLGEKIIRLEAELEHRSGR